MIPYSKQYISSLDIKNVEKVLKSNFLTQGPQVEIFEKKLCEYTGAKYSAAVNSATSGLHLSCIALGIKKNDHVWTVSNTFVSTANCARLCGAIVSFLDIDLKPAVKTLSDGRNAHTCIAPPDWWAGQISQKCSYMSMKISKSKTKDQESHLFVVGIPKTEYSRKNLNLASSFAHEIFPFLEAND